MEFSIDNIDLNEVPGYTPITKSTPIWKRDMIEKKNQEKIEEYIAQKKREKEEAEKWKNVPAWKRKLMMEKEKEKSKKMEEDTKRTKEEEEARRQKLKEQQEMERRMQEEMQEVPEWKREIMMKRGGAIRNWADEREENNEQENEDGQRDAESDSFGDPSAKVFTQKATLVLKPQSQEKEVKKAAPPPPRRSLDEAKIEEEWDSLPLWKREIMMKRGGAPTNWGDEREEVNEDMLEQ